MKRTIKYLFRIVIIIIALASLYFLSAYCFSRITINKNAQPVDEVAIYIKTNGVHTDIVVPIKNPTIDWRKIVSFADTREKDSLMQFVAFGWGDKSFYLETPNWSDLKFKVAFNAAFGLSTTAIHATFYKSLAENESCKKIEISQQQYEQLSKYILASFQLTEHGDAINIPTNANYGNSDAFYEAKGTYNLFYTCNTWANNALKVSGQKCCLWTIFDTGIFLKYQ